MESLKMRKFPKKCPKCGVFGEPLFKSGFSTVNPSWELVGWYCQYCKEEFDYIDNEDE